MDWGSVPAWVGAILTSGSLMIAAFAYRRSVLDKERDQASKIAAWVSVVERDGEKRRQVHISNGSEGSVYDVTVRPKDSPDRHLEELPASSMIKVELPGPVQESSKVSTRTMEASIFSLTAAAGIETETILPEPSPELEFTDGLGRWWRRAPRGEVKRIRSRTKNSYFAQLDFPLVGRVKVPLPTDVPTERTVREGSADSGSSEGTDFSGQQSSRTPAVIDGGDAKPSADR